MKGNGSNPFKLVHVNNFNLASTDVIGMNYYELKNTALGSRRLVGITKGEEDRIELRVKDSYFDSFMDVNSRCVSHRNNRTICATGTIDFILSSLYLSNVICKMTYYRRLGLVIEKDSRVAPRPKNILYQRYFDIFWGDSSEILFSEAIKVAIDKTNPEEVLFEPYNQSIGFNF